MKAFIRMTRFRKWWNDGWSGDLNSDYLWILHPVSGFGCGSLVVVFIVAIWFVLWLVFG